VGIVTLTVDDLSSVAFRKSPVGKRGYSEQEVDEFLSRIEATFRAHLDTETHVDTESAAEDAAEMVTPVDVHHVVFTRSSLVKRGYSEQDVDRFLDEVEAQLTALVGGTQIPGPRIARDE